MANYSYYCEEHGEFELSFPIDKRDEAVCPKCGKKLTRKLGVGGIHFKGDGFYTTDYRKKDDKYYEK